MTRSPAQPPELLAPGGSLLAAHYAFEAGADGVYLGLKDFSARKAAVNFSLEQLRRLREEAARGGKRIYLAANTVVKEQELDRLAESLAWAEALGIDGIIVQDLGVAELARRHFPRLALHASTQMAVHNSSGIRVLRGLGFRRIILARELPLERIRALREENPDIELEVFIHGALCYSFSGLCFASWALTGRSGNRGECAQICRSRFKLAPGAPADLPLEGHLFSSRDLAADSLVSDLSAAGVDAFKIEGRMKSPEYVYTTVALYRALLDGETSRPRLDELRRRQRLTFSRRTGHGYLDQDRGDGRLLDAQWPGHRGVEIGTVAAVRGGRLTLTLQGDIGERDGLAYFPPGPGQPADPVQFSALGLRSGPGRQATLDLPPAAAPPRVGQTVYQISSRSLDLRELSEGSFALYRIPCECAVHVGDGRLSVAWTSPLWAQPERYEAPLPTAPARGGQSLAAVVERLFAEAGESLLRPARVTVSGLDDGARQFAPPSVLKRLKNAAYGALEQRLAAWVGERVAAAAADARPGAAPPPRAPAPAAALLPLEPLAVDDASALARAAAEVDRLLAVDPQPRVAVGLANVGHLGWVGELSRRPRVDFFIDYPLYVANRYAFAFYAAAVPRLQFQRFWIEGAEADHAALAASLGDHAASLRRGETPQDLPLFTSLGCFVRNLSGRGARACEGCPRDYELRVSQGRNRFVVRVRDCVTRLYRDT